jgi:hypothetical protein
LIASPLWSGGTVIAAGCVRYRKDSQEKQGQGGDSLTNECRHP